MIIHGFDMCRVFVSAPGDLELAEVVKRQTRTLALLERRQTIRQVGQGEVAPSVAAISGAQQRKQRCIL